MGTGRTAPPKLLLSDVKPQPFVLIVFVGEKPTGLADYDLVIDIHYRTTFGHNSTFVFLLMLSKG
jgi:hypothetical protein